MYYWLKHFNLKLLLDWMLYGKYKFLQPWWITLDFAKKYKMYLWNKKLKNELIKWLDNDSTKTINQIEKNIGFILKQNKPYYKKSDFWIFENEEIIEKEINEYTKDIYLPKNHKEQTVFYYKHWINFIKDIKKKIEWKDIIDCWAFIWDSAMMFSKELWFIDSGGVINKIYCLEPDPKNIELLKDTLKKNNRKWYIKPIPLGVWQKKESLYISLTWSTSSVWRKDNESYKIQIDTLDNIVKNYWITPWMIKWDIEWLEYNSILWAKATIKEYHPILLISIYHNWRDFYKIKPLIESWGIWYNFKIKHLSTHPFFETVLICY